ncbi:MAG: hypothetical protein ACC661_06195, partial [Verrucomicrobiales bacterium]
MKNLTLVSMMIGLLVACGTCLASGIPEEPVAIGTGPQFLFDHWIVDNHWAIKYKREAVVRVFHQPVKDPGNPVMSGDQPSYTWVIRDSTAEGGLYRMYYQANYLVVGAKAKGRKFKTRIAYAQSKDGVRW